MSIKVGKKEGASGEEGGYKVTGSQGASRKKTGKCVNDLFFFFVYTSISGAVYLKSHLFDMPDFLHEVCKSEGQSAHPKTFAC